MAAGRALAGYSLDEVSAALNEAVAVAERMPPPGRIAADIRAARRRKHLEDETRRLLAEPAPAFAARLPPPPAPPKKAPKQVQPLSPEEKDAARARLAA